MENEDIITRFYKKLSTDAPNKCWDWQGSFFSRGYPSFYDGNKNQLAKTFSYKTFVGKIPDGMVILSSCKNRKCVNPYHLLLGTLSQAVEENYDAVINRFWKKVEKSDSCWNWKGSFRKSYGRFQFNKKVYPAHRFIWEHLYGELPKDLFVCHSCDNRKCVNPSHLFVGTHEENMSDMSEKGRSPKMPGEKNPAAKLKTENILDIRKRKADGETLEEIANRYKISFQHVSDIVNLKRWKHI